MSRGLCLFRSFRMDDLPLRERANALNIRIDQWSPFAVTGQYVIQHKSSAQVWIWDEGRRRKAAEAASANGIRVCPESALYPEPDTDGVRALACAEGYDVQIWQKGLIVASRWWPIWPKEIEIDRFLIAHDMDPEAFHIEPESLSWLVRPRGGTGGYRGMGVAGERFWVMLLLAAYALFVIWHGIAIIRWHHAAESMERRVERRIQEAEPIINRRAQAMEYRQRAFALGSIPAYPRQLQMMAAVAEILPDTIVIAEWRYNLNELTVVLKGPDLDPRIFVARFQKLGFFEDVSPSGEDRPNYLALKIRVAEKGKG